ncbi:MULTISPECIES: flagellin lysine-N-methylase [unclassified Fibrobacter]|uniref:flagellin lysine-N-methylase n=1 Tax=unclassified Fibrobacter TaxID=2634177 RepID=UPI000D6D6949|nr:MULTISPECIES: flagellin lysine-N-methylase [unclassified Fibrobacter]PWJ69063.1 lysine-N-methylase [Fibrobacter sp. UWR4]PZW72894.1 lysine-N-methylase [Fibrobacter sp. UWR1]
MLLRSPVFYHQFQCIADKCTDTCCVGWEIDIDEKSLEKYRQLPENGPDESRRTFGKRLLENIEEGHFKLLPGDRCPFLKENGLCDMICHLGCKGTDLDENGESILCNICREHPRFVEVYGDIMEKGLGLCCEEAARLLLTSETSCRTSFGISSLSFAESEIDEEPDEMPEDAKEARDAIFAERSHMFELMADSSKSLNQRLIDVLDYAESVNSYEEDSEKQDDEEPELSPDAIQQTWIEILGEGESFGPAWDNAYERMIRKGWPLPTSCRTRSGISLFTDEDGARIVTYLLYRYYAKSLFDGDGMTKVQFAIYFWIMLQKFGDVLAAGSPADATDLTRKINAIKLLSKQTEYSEEIMEILADNFFQNEAFSVSQFRNIITALQS